MRARKLGVAGAALIVVGIALIATGALAGGTGATWFGTQGRVPGRPARGAEASLADGQTTHRLPPLSDSPAPGHRPTTAYCHARRDRATSVLRGSPSGRA